MNRLEVLKAQATRQFRHNDDNSPDVFNPEGGFVFAYDRDVIDKGLAELQAKLAARDCEIERLTEFAKKGPYIEGEFEKRIAAEAKLAAVEALPEKWRKKVGLLDGFRYVYCADDLEEALK
jgi:hypothetical protein